MSLDDGRMAIEPRLPRGFVAIHQRYSLSCAAEQSRVADRTAAHEGHPHGLGQRLAKAEAVPSRDRAAAWLTVPDALPLYDQATVRHDAAALVRIRDRPCHRMPSRESDASGDGAGDDHRCAGPASRCGDIVTPRRPRRHSLAERRGVRLPPDPDGISRSAGVRQQGPMRDRNAGA